MGIAKLALMLAKYNRNHLLKFGTGPYYGFLTRTRTIATNAAEEEPPPNNIQEEGLGARLSFVVQELENIQKQKAEKTAAHEKLRLWRDKNTNILNTTSSTNTNVEGSVEMGFQIEKDLVAAGQGFDTQLAVTTSPGEIAHPWPEWIDLMERLVKQRYFDKTRFRNGDGDDDIVEKLSGGECSSSVSSMDDENLAVLDGDFDVFKDINSVRKAFLDFGRDRYDILRLCCQKYNICLGLCEITDEISFSMQTFVAQAAITFWMNWKRFLSLSRKDIQILVGYGCPSLDKKVVLSGKRLRAYVHLDEGDVCSSCKLRETCPTAYIAPCKEDFEARTMDVMRILMIYGLDPLINSAENKLHKQKAVKTAVCSLLKEVFRLSAAPLDPNFPKPVFVRPPPKVKEPQPPPRKRIGRNDVEMKKGDWLCPKCDFLNFAKNNLCLQCEAERPKRLLNPGEWECPGCNFLNYRRNMTCYNCDRKRPEDEYTKNLGQGRDDNDSQQSRYPNKRLERPLSMISSSKAWNDDFDDDESDGADVAAFEYGDSSKILEGPLMNVNREIIKDGRFDDDSFDFHNLPMHGRERVKGQNKIEGWKQEQNVTDLKMDMRPVSPNDRVKAFNDFGDFDEDEQKDAVDCSLNKIQSSRSYGRANMPSTSSRRNERGYDSDEHLKAYQREDSQSFRRPLQRGRSKDTYESSDEDNDEDSSELESDDEGTEWKKGNKGGSLGKRGRGSWNQTGKRGSFEQDPNDSDDEDPCLSRQNGNRGKDARFSRRDTSFSSRGRKGFKNEDNFEGDCGAKRNRGSVTGCKGAEKNWNGGGQDDSSRERQHNSDRGETLFGPREGDRLKRDTSFEGHREGGRLKRDTGFEGPRGGRFKRDTGFEGPRGGRFKRDTGFEGPRGGRLKRESRFEGEPHNERKFGKTDGYMGSAGPQNRSRRDRNDLFNETPRSGRETSFRSRGGGRTQSNHDFDKLDEERYNGRNNVSKRNEKRGRGRKETRGIF